MSFNIDEEFPEGTRVQHSSTLKVGTVQKDFGGPAAGAYYHPWELPVVWDEENFVTGVSFENLIKM